MSMSEPSNPISSPPKKKVSPVRNVIGLILLVVLSGAAIFEVSANRGWDAAYKKVSATLPDEDANPTGQIKELPSQDQVEKLIGKKPDGPLTLEGTEQMATYSWQGLRRKYLLKAYYTRDKTPSLVRIAPE